MKKRLSCLLLALVMVISLIPVGIITASADIAGVSEAGIKLIKSYVGFHQYAYQVGTEWKIGYGTAGAQGQVITEANADKELRDELATYKTAINGALGANALQKRYDALAWYRFAEGALPSGLNYAVPSKSEFVNKLVQGSQYSASYPGTDADKAVVNRRLAIANLYINGTYSTSTGSMGYTLFHAGDGNFAGSKLYIMAFDGNDGGVQIPVSVGAAISGAPGTFLGWYDGSNLVTGLSSALNGKVLYARYEGAAATEVAANYTLPGYYIYKASGLADTDTCQVMSSYSGGVQIDTISRESTVRVVAEHIVAGSPAEKWIKLSTGGWVKLCKMNADLPILIQAQTITITDDIVNIRQDPSFTAAKVGTATRGQTKTIVMTNSTSDWGYCSEGWIYLAYTNYKGEGAASTTGGAAVEGKVYGADRVNVRAGAGTGYNIVTTVAAGTTVKVYEQTTVNGASWGRIDQGWIALQYVQLSASSAASTINAGATVYVSSSVNLNVRKGPGTQYAKVTSLAPGTPCVIYQKQVVNGVTWGLTDQGWINLNYVTAAASSGSGTGSAVVTGIGGTVVNCATAVNVRAAAGTGNALVGSRALGSRVTVTERVQVNGYYWGHIDGGWVCMDYIRLDSEWKDSTVASGEQINNTVTSFAGYPVTVTVDTPLYASASSDAKVTMTMRQVSNFTVSAFQVNGTKIFGKAMVNGVFQGWVDMSAVTMSEFNAKVTAEKANTYEEPSTRAAFYAALVKGTAVKIAAGEFSKAGGWVLDNGVLWGKLTDGGHTCWIKLSDVTQFLDNTAPTGETTLNGVGYMTGKIQTSVTLYKDSNGNISSDTAIYTLVPNQTVNIQALQLMGGKTYAKVTVGSVTGWFEMTAANVVLDPVEMKTTAEVVAYTDAALTAVDKSYAAGTKVTVTGRTLKEYTDGIVKKLQVVGTVYFNDDIYQTRYIVLDSGKLSYVSAASSTAANPSIGISVAVTGKLTAAASIRSDVDTGSAELLKVNAGTEVTVMNWLNIGTTTWCKVQVGTIVGWIQMSEISFAGLQGTVAVDSLALYAMADKSSAVQILNCNKRAVDIIALVFDGTTLWGNIDINGKPGWVDMKNLTLGTPSMADPASVITGPTIATAKTNSHNIMVTIEWNPDTSARSQVASIPKGTSLNLLKVKVVSGKAYWYANFGDADYLDSGLLSLLLDKNGWVEMNSLTMGSVTATVSVASQEVFADLALSGDPVYTLYRNEQVAIREFAMSNDGQYLCGEIAVNGDTGWIKIADSTGALVGLKPGASQTVTTSGAAASTTTTTTSTTTSSTSTGTAGYITGAASVNIRSYAGIAPDNLVTSLPNGTAVVVTETTVVGGKTWGHIAQGWVCMDYVRTGTATTVTTGTTVISKPTVMTTVPSGAAAVGYANQDLVIYGGAGFGYGKVGTVPKNGAVVIYENCLSGGVSWGRTDQGWVILSYVVLTGIGGEGSGTMGTIGRCGFTAKVRNSANGLELSNVMVSSRVAILETSGNWARTAIGWICTDYIVMSSDLPPASTTTAESSAETVTTPTGSGVEEVG